GVACLFNVFDPRTGDAYLMAFDGRQFSVYFVSVGNLATYPGLSVIQMPLTAFRFIGMGAPESTTGSGSSLMGMPSMMLNRVAQMDELRRDSDARGVETLRAAL
ncbi:hypothetical protein RZS08_04490, partial [Arthrospira platensis SPKY1]|nr:hypothetical protein [Arthrospira platensis SPKY1]